jgi:hypothetical protein
MWQYEWIWMYQQGMQTTTNGKWMITCTHKHLCLHIKNYKWVLILRNSTNQNNTHDNHGRSPFIVTKYIHFLHWKEKWNLPILTFYLLLFQLSMGWAEVISFEDLTDIIYPEWLDLNTNIKERISFIHLVRFLSYFCSDATETCWNLINITELIKPAFLLYRLPVLQIFCYCYIHTF